MDRLLINSVVRTFRLLEAVCATKEPVKLSDLSKKLNLSIGATQRITHTLMQIGYLEKDHETKAYKTTARILSLGYNHLSNYEIRNIALPFMKDLNKKIDEVVNLAVLDNKEILYIERIDTSHGLTTNVRVGSRKPIHCTSMGKVLLAHLPGEELDMTLSGLTLRKYSERTITDKRILKSELRTIRDQGFSLNEGELSEGIFSIAVPLINYEGRAAGAVNFVVPITRLDRKKAFQMYLPELILTGKSISAKLQGKKRKETI
jgi:DNA-binding IclR family transcriptional regulator